MLNTETYTSDSQAAPLTAGQVAGAAHHAATSVNGKAANGAAIALFDHQGADIDLNKATSAVALQNGPNSLNFTAYVQGQPSAIQNQSITEGEFTSVANFVLAYQ